MRNKNIIPDRSIGSIVEESYVNFGRYVNLSRNMPFLYDGLKPSYKKALYAAIRVASDHEAKAASVLGEVVKYYPHGSQHIEPILNLLANYGIMDDIGNNGRSMLIKQDVPAAASRYLDVRVNDKWSSLMKTLLPYVPYTKSDLGYDEPKYLPTPIPIGLIFGYTSMSCGANNEIPAFTPRSILDAYINNDPTRLVMNFGLELVKDDSDLDNIWSKGDGKLSYKFQISSDINERTWIIKGNPLYYRTCISANKIFDERSLADLIKDGTVTAIENINHFTNLNEATIVLNNKNYDVDEFNSAINRIFSGYKLVKLTVSNGDKIGRIGLYNWIDTTLNNYLGLLDSYKSDNIAKLEHEKLVLESIPKVVAVLIEHRDWENDQISKESKVPINIVSEVMKRPISSLKRNKDYSARIKAIDVKILEFKNLDSEEFVKTTINSMSDGTNIV